MHSPQPHATSTPKPAATAVGPAPERRQPARSRDALLRLQRQYGNRRARAIIQAKLNVGPADDPFEREADRISRLAMGSSAQRAPEKIQRVHGATGGAADPAVEQAVTRARGGGRPVPGGVRERMERVSGADLGGVRVHVDSESDRLNEALGSRAFTVGADVFVRRSEYRPGSARGDALLGHELVHTVQQGGNRLETGLSGAPSVQCVKKNEKESKNDTRRDAFSDLRDRIRNGEKKSIKREELVQAVKQYIRELIANQPYRTRESPEPDTEPVPVAIDPDAVDKMTVIDGDYTVSTDGTMLFLPADNARLINDIESGWIRVAVSHEVGHWIHDIDPNDPTGGPDEVLDLITETLAKPNYGKASKHGVKSYDPEAWDRETAADLRGIWFRYRMTGELPDAREIELGNDKSQRLGTADNEHPSPAWRVKTMKKFMKNIEEKKTGKKSGWCYLTTACAEARGLSDDCEELTLLREFRDTYLAKKPNARELIELYYRYAPRIVAEIDSSRDRVAVYEYIYGVVRDCVEAIKRGELEDTYLKYCEMVVKMKDDFIPGEPLPEYSI